VRHSTLASPNPYLRRNFAGLQLHSAHSALRRAQKATQESFDVRPLPVFSLSMRAFVFSDMSSDCRSLSLHGSIEGLLGYNYICVDASSLIPTGGLPQPSFELPPFCCHVPPEKPFPNLSGCYVTLRSART
jgi:hypothetical protein